MNAGAAKTTRRALGIVVALVLATAFFFVLDAALRKGATEADETAFGHVTAILILVLFSFCVHKLGSGIGGIVMGKDGRVSTSKVQVVMWTYVIAAAILSLIVAEWVGLDAGFKKLTDPDFDIEDYLVLLGGPFAAAIWSRAVVGSQVASGERAKPPGEPTPSQVVTGDDGSADLIDTQYLLFNLVAAIYFVGAFVQDPQAGLPNIPTVLLVLAGVSAAGYASNKAISEGTPKVNGVFPGKGLPATEVEVFGVALLYPKTLGTGDVSGGVDLFHEVGVTIGGYEAPFVAGSLIHSRAGDDRLKVLVPPQLTDPGLYDVVVLNFRGTSSTAGKFEVVAAGG